MSRVFNLTSYNQGRESLIRQAMMEAKDAGLSDKTTGGLMSKAERGLIKGPHNKTDRILATFELMSEGALRKKIEELKKSGEKKSNQSIFGGDWR